LKLKPHYVNCENFCYRSSAFNNHAPSWLRHCRLLCSNEVVPRPVAGPRGDGRSPLPADVNLAYTQQIIIKYMQNCDKNMHQTQPFSCV